MARAHAAAVGHTMIAPDPDVRRADPPVVSFARDAAGAWCPDIGDGTYRNPVLYADYSDPDAIRVGDDYWLTSSSFGHVPGLPILHSRDLVNWSLVNHALPRLVPPEHFSRPRHGQGVWAPTIRFHQGKFWIFYPDPDFGLYAITAADPRGSWSTPVLVKAGKGLIDPCPLWDADGTGYLIHAWARSRSGICNRLTLHRLAPDNLNVIDEGRVVVEGSAMSGWHTIEGPKLYRRGNWYYIFAPAGGVTDGYQAVFRSRSIEGPYEARIVLARGSTPVNGPHQGAWVDTPDGGGWFLHFQEMRAYGRVVHLQPLVWRDDDWPVIGDDPQAKGCGEPVLVHRKPRALVAQPSVPATSDPFAACALGLQWQWQANPAPQSHALLPNTGLRLFCVPHAPEETLWHAAHLLLQKFPGPAFTATTVLRFSPQADGEQAGLVVFGHDYAWLGLRREGDRVRLVLRQCLCAHEEGQEEEVSSAVPPTDAIYLRVTVQPGALCEFAWSSDGQRFHGIGAPFRARSSYWVGAKVGLFARGGGGELTSNRGHADFRFFTVGAV